MGRIFKVVLTGGPCGGKTTVLTKLTGIRCSDQESAHFKLDAFENHGWTVFRVGELASFILGSGVDFSAMTSGQGTYGERSFDLINFLQFQRGMLKTRLAMENLYDDLAVSKAGETTNILIIYDRGLLDILAYLDPLLHEPLLEEFGIDRCLQNRYDCVLHLRTAAYGAKQFYTLANNISRSESPESARLIDEACMKAWMGHPYYTLIENDAFGFGAKLDKTVKAALSHAGLEDFRQSSVRRRKFLLGSSTRVAVSQECQVLQFYVEHQTLKPSDDGITFNRIRKRTSACSPPTWTLMTSHVQPETGVIIESRRSLSERERETMLPFANTNHHMICKTSRCFVHGGHFFQLDEFTNEEHAGLQMIEAYIPKDDPVDWFPSFIPHPLKEVSGDPTYKLSNLSRKQ